MFQNGVEIWRSVSCSIIRNTSFRESISSNMIGWTRVFQSQKLRISCISKQIFPFYFNIYTNLSFKLKEKSKYFNQEIRYWFRKEYFDLIYFFSIWFSNNFFSKKKRYWNTLFLLCIKQLPDAQYAIILGTIVGLRVKHL